MTAYFYEDDIPIADDDILSHYLSDDDAFYQRRSSLTFNYEWGPLGPWTMENFDTHQTICVWIMKVMGSLSMLASYFIIRDIVIRYYQRERIRLTSKVIFELSVGDFFGSFFSAVMGTWMVPKESGAYMAAGSQASCTAQGVLIAFFYGIAITMNAVLAMLYYYLVKNDRGDFSRTKRSVRLILGLPLMIPIFLSVMPLIYSGYNYTDAGVCGVGEFPLGCLVFEDVFPDGCNRGTKAMGMKFIQLGFILLINIIIDGSVVLMFCHAWSRDRRMIRSTNAATDNNATNSSSIQDDNAINHVTRKSNNSYNITAKFVYQGIWYVASFQAAWFPWYVWQWLRIIHQGEEVLGPFASVTLLYVLSITHPSQGCLNSLVYFRPSYIKYRHRDEHEFRLASICRVLNIPVPRVLLVEWWTSLFCKRKTEEADDTVGGGDATRSQKIGMEDAMRGEEPPPQDAAGND